MTVMVPHFAFPFSVNGSSFIVREQDSVEEIQDCVTVLVLTPVGSRLVLPSYGTPETLYAQTPVDVDSILTNMNEWEPRASVVLAETLDTLDEKITYIRAQIGGMSS